MEKQTQKTEIPTKETTNVNVVPQGAFFSLADAEEYRAYKRRKKVNEVNVAIARSQSSVTSGEDIQRVCDRAVRLKQSAVKVPLTKLTQAGMYLMNKGVRLDCNVGGNGETLTKIKVFETRLAVKRKAGEITLTVTPSYLDACRYAEIRREMKRVKRAAGKALLKVRVEKTYSPTALARVARIACETGAAFFSVPYFEGCLRLKMDLTRGCQLEVTGVQTTADFKKLAEGGAGRILTDRAWEIYSELLREANELPVTAQSLENKAQKITVATLAPAPTATPLNATANALMNCAKSANTTNATNVPSSTGAVSCAKPALPLTTAVKNPETDYCCKLEGSELKFL